MAATATQRWVEDPIRHGRLIGLKTRRSLALAGVAIVCIATAIVILRRHDRAARWFSARR